jgi:hypothetical protein
MPNSELLKPHYLGNQMINRKKNKNIISCNKKKLYKKRLNFHTFHQINILKYFCVNYS